MFTLLDEFPFPVWRSPLDGKGDFVHHAWLNFPERAFERETHSRGERALFLPC
jgi:hypothetical protein